MPGKKDNSTLREKVALRRAVLKNIPSPVVLETYGGAGVVGDYVYREVQRGAVLERSAAKTDLLVRKRPSWSVYEGDALQLLRAGIADHLPINLVDVDTYGVPWETLDALFCGRKRWELETWLVVTDASILHSKMSGGPQGECFHELRQRWGHRVHVDYPQKAEWLIRKKAAVVGFTVSGFRAVTCGYLQQMTLWAACLTPTGVTAPADAECDTGGCP